MLKRILPASRIKVGMWIIPDPESLSRGNPNKGFPAEVMSIYVGFGGNWADVKFANGETASMPLWDCFELDNSPE